MRKEYQTAPAEQDLWAGLWRRHQRWTITVILMAVLVVLFGGLAMSFGNVYYTPLQVLQTLLGKETGENITYAVLELRLPRVLTAFLAGAAFGVSGFVFQTVLRNPLASPDIIGVSSSSSAAAVFCISILGMSGISVSVAALAAGFIVSFLVYFLSSRNGFSQTKMILTGIGVEALTQALISWVLSKTSEYNVTSAMRWMSGSLNDVRMKDAAILVVPTVAGIVLLSILGNRIRLIELGDEYAATLGGNPGRLYPVLIVISVVMIGFCTAVTGPISSVAFLSGPLSSRVSGRSRSGLLPAALTGSILVLAGDFIGQNAFSVRFPAGIITGLLGGPYLLYLLVSINKKGKV